MSQELIESRWDETKTALLEGLSGNRRTTMSMVLKIQRSILLKAQVLVQLLLVTLQHLTVLSSLLSAVLCQLLLQTKSLVFNQ